MCVFVCVCDTSVLMEEEKQVERDIGLNHEGGIQEDKPGPLTFLVESQPLLIVLFKDQDYRIKVEGES